jgi:hypothetical protein
MRNRATSLLLFFSMTTEQLIQALSEIDPKQLTAETVQETSDTILELNQQQMEQGIDQDGEKIHWLKDSHYPYTRQYANRKSKLGLQTSVVDLKLTGNFYRSNKIRIESDEVDYFNDGELGDILEKNYGKQIFGLTDENKQVYREGVFAETFREKFSAKTTLQFK